MIFDHHVGPAAARCIEHKSLSSGNTCKMTVAVHTSPEKKQCIYLIVKAMGVCVCELISSLPLLEMLQ